MIAEGNRARFLTALESAQSLRRPAGIGTLGEKTLHAALKRYLEPLERNHETRIGPYVADIVGEEGIVEIQTGGFDRLRKKLSAFLDVARVTVVYPIPHVKWLVWIDPETGEVTSRRKSPMRGCFQRCFPELYRIKNLLTHPNLRLRLILLDLEEYRQLNGWSADRKRGSTRYERIPLRLEDELVIDEPRDYAKLIPDALEEPFTVKEFGTLCRLSPRAAGTALNVLHSVGAVRRDGKRGRAYLYRRTV